MFVAFFHDLKAAGVPVTLREYLTLIEAMEKDLAGRRVEDFYYLSRAALIKDERNLDKFDRVFGHVFKGLTMMSEALEAEIPSQWLKKLAEKYLTEEEKQQIEAMGGLDKLIEHFYFHNCLYEKVWKENRRRWDDTTPTWELLHTYGHDYKLIFVGDASMSPYEITSPGGSVEHFNAEPGSAWIERVTRTYPACVWLNPVPEGEWETTQSIRMLRQLMGGRMYP